MIPMQPPDAGSDPQPNPDPNPALQAAESEVARLREELETLRLAVEAGRLLIATERAAREQAEKAVRLLEQSNDAKLEMWQQAERERDTALESAAACARTVEHFRWERDTALARVKELERSLQLSKSQRETIAETALASVAAAVSDLDTYGESRADDAGRLARRIREILSSHPSPALVAAPCAGCAAARELLGRCDAVLPYAAAHKLELVEEVRAWLKEHP